MPLADDDLIEIDTILSAADAVGPAVAELRRRFPHLSWTRCDASDMAETPFRTYARFEVHLLDGADHCVQITADPARATGLVVAERKALP